MSIVSVVLAYSEVLVFVEVSKVLFVGLVCCCFHCLGGHYVG